MWTSKSNELCRILGIKYPIIQAPMAGGITTPELIAEVSNAGGLGSLGAGYMSPRSLQEAIKKVKLKTSFPFSVNLFIPSAEIHYDISDQAKKELGEIAHELGIEDLNFSPIYKNEFDEQLQVICDEEVPVVSFTFGVLQLEHIAKVRKYGGKIIGTATSVYEAKILQEYGCDLIVAQGFEAGGHRGSFKSIDKPPLIGLMSLIPQVTDEISIPVVASGGIADGRGIVASLFLGASGVQIGTAFITTDESGAAEVWKNKLLNSTDTDTVLTKTFSGKYARGVKNKFIERLDGLEDELPSYPILNTITESIRSQSKKTSNHDYMSLWSGQSSKLCRKLTANKLMKTLVQETNELLTSK